MPFERLFFENEQKTTVWEKIPEKSHSSCGAVRKRIHISTAVFLRRSHFHVCMGAPSFFNPYKDESALSVRTTTA